MKKTVVLASIAALMASACSVVPEIEVNEPDSPTYTFTLNATMDSELTKTAYENEKTFSWSAGDQISVLFHNGDVNKFFTLTNTTGAGTSATFSGEIESGYEICSSNGEKIALFPAGDHYYDRTKAKYDATDYPKRGVFFNIPALTDFTETHFSANLPMAAIGDADNNFAFKHISGSYKVVFSNIDASVTKVKLHVKNQISRALSGDFRLENGGSHNYCWWWTSAAEGSLAQTVSYIVNVIDGKATFYIPYSNGDGDGFQPILTLTNAVNGNTLKQVSAKAPLSGSNVPSFSHMVVLPEIPASGTGSAPGWRSSNDINWDLVKTVIEGRSSSTYGGINSMKFTADATNAYILLDINKSYLLDNDSYDFSNHGVLFIGDGSDSGSVAWMWSTHYQSLFQAWLKTGNNLSCTATDGVLVNATANESGDHVFYEIAVPRTGHPGFAGTTAYIGFVFDKRYIIGETVYKDPINGDTYMGYAPTPNGNPAMAEVSLPDYVAPSASVSSPLNLKFTEADDEVQNPERGLYNQTSFYFNGESLPSLSISNSHIEPLELVLFYLTGYKSKDLDDDVLNAIGTVFSNLKAAGKKAIVRFGYSSDHQEADKPWDASKDQIIKHIQQLKPIFTANEDIIYVMQAGFIGTYGEWYYTGNNNPAVSGVDDFYYSVSGSSVVSYENQAAVLDELLDAVPASRQIAVRTPFYKRYYLSPDSINSWNAISSWDGTDANSRIGFFNDGFLADNGNDTGTFKDDYDWAMWNGQSAKLVVGGETAYQSSEPNPTYCGHDVAIERIANGHVSYLNKNTGNKIMTYWINNNYLTDICKALGYRLVVNSADITFTSLNSGATVNYSIAIQNKGKTTVIYPRPFKLVLVHNGEPSVLADFGDVRNLAPGAAATTFSGSVTLPQTVMQYDQLAIWLPDADILDNGLDEIPAYSIRLANSDVTWSNGFNVLYTF